MIILLSAEFAQKMIKFNILYDLIFPFFRAVLW